MQRNNYFVLVVVIVFIFIYMCLLYFENIRDDYQKINKEQSERFTHLYGSDIILGTGRYFLNSQNGTRKGNISWSQYGQDLYIDDLFRKKQNGFFVEVGGYDGETFSNTLLLEKERNWSGLLIEANPYTFQMMKNKDRRSYMINSCIHNEKPYMTFLIAGGITSAEDTLTQRHKNRISTDKKVYGRSPTWAHAGQKVKVKCSSILSMLEQINQTYIDYFSLDVEGAELFILNSINWNKIVIDVFTIETDQHRSKIIEFMTNIGYKRIQKLTGDDVFKRMH